MIFKVDTIGNFYSREQVDKLSLLGLKFRYYESDYGDFIKEDDQLGELEVNTLEDLKDFTNKYGAIIFDGEDIRIFDDRL